MQATPPELLRELVTRVLTGHDTTALDSYLDPRFLLWCNGSSYDLTSLRARLTDAFADSDGYAVDFDDHAWVTTDDRVAARLWISFVPAEAEPSDSEILVVATVAGGRFDRAWVLAWPDRVQIHHQTQNPTASISADNPPKGNPR